MIKTVDYKELLKEYRDFLQWDNEETTDYKNMSQEDAKQALINDLDFIIGTNGVSELYERELEYCKLLNIDLEV